MNIRMLNRDEFAIYRDIRLEALKAEPFAFVSDYGEALHRSDQDWQDILVNIAAFVAFENDQPIGLTSLRVDTGNSVCHRGQLINVYVTPVARGIGTAKALLGAALAHAEYMGLLQVELAVNAQNERAIRFYEREGFAKAGAIPRGFRVKGQFFDELFMVRALDGA